MKVLFAEDDSTSRAILTAMLRKWQLDPIVAEDGMAALELMQQEDAPLLAILDWGLPGLSGVEICRRIRRQKNYNPPYIILLTVKNDKNHVVAGLDAGADDYISKPYDQAELYARIQVGLRQVGQQSKLLATQRALSYDAMHDALTGALNRRAILDALEKELIRSGRRASAVSIAMIDIDHFKRINDNYGHQTGDDILQKLVETVQSGLRGYDLIGRYGGEEFLIIAPESSGTGKEGLYDRLRRRIAATNFVSRCGKKITLSVSIGVTGVTREATVDDMLSNADKALYQAKRSGRDCVVYATP